MIRISSLLFSLLLCLSLSAQTNWVYVSPVPGSKMINPENTIALRNGEVLDMSTVDVGQISVIGSSSGIIDGDLILSRDGRTLIFKPAKTYSYAETIQVNLSQGIQTITGKMMEALSFTFTVKPGDTRHLNRLFEHAEQEETHASSAPQSDREVLYSYDQLIKYGDADLPENFPAPEITAYNNPSPQLAFYANEPAVDRYGTYAVMTDNYGTPVFYREWPIKAVNFQLVANQQFIHKNSDDHPVSPNNFLVLDSMYNPIDTLRVGNGYNTNTHDGMLLANGNHYLMIYDAQAVGMDTVVPGGDPNATVKGFILQELDADHNVIFQWRSWDHFEITSANNVDLTKATVDYVHVNAYDTTSDGNILLCCRHFDEITKIDRNTGDIIWRFGPGAQNNMFTFSNDTMGFSYPHDIQQLANGNLTLYDNGNFHNPKFSRGLEYEIDEVNLTATQVWSFEHDPSFYCSNKGSTRRLPNGNSIIGWGNSLPIISTEAGADGQVAWELSVDSCRSYRVMKFDWVTPYFETNFDTIDYGYFDDYVSWPIIFTVTNNADHDISITSATNHLDVFYLGTEFPVDIPEGGSENIIVYFFPENMPNQNFNDVLTLNYDSFYQDTLPQRIARQIVLKGTTVEPLKVKLNESDEVSIIPNPTHGLCLLNADQGLITSLKVYNAIGKLLFEESAISEKQYALDLSSFQNGVYFLQMTTTAATKPIIKKLVKN